MSSDASAVKRKPGRPKKVAVADPTSKAKTTTRTATSDQQAPSEPAKPPAKKATKKQSSLKTSVDSDSPSVAPKSTGTKETSVAGSGKRTRGQKTGQGLGQEIPTAIEPGQSSAAADTPPPKIQPDSSSGDKKEVHSNEGETPRITTKNTTKTSPILQEADWSSALKNSTATSKPTSEPVQSPASQLANSIAKTQKQPPTDPKNYRPNSTAKTPAFRVVPQPGAGGAGGTGTKVPQPDVQKTTKYKSYARRWVTTMIAVPILLVTSYALYQRVMLNQQPVGLPGVNAFPPDSVSSHPAAGRQKAEEKPADEN